MRMGAIKVTFTLDQATVTRLRDAASRLAISKSEVVRKALHEFHDRMGSLGGNERARMLSFLDEYMSRPAPRTADEVAREIAEVRRARRRQ